MLIIRDGSRFTAHSPTSSCLVLPPRFVERCPYNDAGMKVQRFDHAIKLEHVLLMRLQLAIRHPADSSPFESTADFSSADLILPHHHAQSITVIVIATWLNLDVLADHVKARSFQEFNVDNIASSDGGVSNPSGHQP
jgi:hypothetical protein